MFVLLWLLCLASLGAAQTVSTPEPTGKSGVGTRWLPWVDSSRENLFSSDGTNRELMVRLWYPSAAAAECRPAEYSSARVWMYVSQVSGLPLPRVTTHSCLNTPVADGAHPVLIFSHGYTGTFTDATFLFEDLASRGYVVISIAHTYESTAVEFPNGRLITSLFGSYLQGDSLRGDEHSLRLVRSVRLADVKFVLNQVQQGQFAGGMFGGKLDFSRMGVMGHSLGAEVALASLESDARLRAAVLLDAPIVEQDTRGTDKPVLILGAGRDRWSDEECSLWNNLRGPRLAVNLRGTAHLTPTDAVWLFRESPEFIPAGSQGPEKTVTLLRGLVAGFFDSHLRGNRDSSVLKPELARYRDALVTSQNQNLCSPSTASLRGEIP